MSTAARNIQQTKVVGAGGRPRTVWKCEMGCWHNSLAQATKCKSGSYKAELDALTVTGMDSTTAIAQLNTKTA